MFLPLPQVDMNLISGLLLQILTNLAQLLLNGFVLGLPTLPPLNFQQTLFVLIVMYAAPHGQQAVQALSLSQQLLTEYQLLLLLVSYRASSPPHHLPSTLI